MNELLLIIILVFGGQTIGSLVGIIKSPSRCMICCFLAFAGAMMIGISFLELIPEALGIMSSNLVLIGFLVGALIMLGVDRLLPHINPELCKKEKPNMKRSVTLLVVGIALHNLPEGLAIGVGFALDPGLGILIAIGIATQDIPENIATVISVYGLVKKRLKSVLILISTILFELVGFLLGYYIFKSTSPFILGFSLTVAAGFMTYLSVEELIPAARKEGKPYPVAVAMILGGLAVLLMISVF